MTSIYSTNLFKSSRHIDANTSCYAGNLLPSLKTRLVGTLIARYLLLFSYPMSRSVLGMSRKQGSVRSKIPLSNLETLPGEASDSVLGPLLKGQG